MGLPRAHQLRKLTELGQSVLPEYVHRHRFFNPQQAPRLLPIILDPQIQPRCLQELGVSLVEEPLGLVVICRSLIVTRSRQLRNGGTNSGT